MGTRHFLVVSEKEYSFLYCVEYDNDRDKNKKTASPKRQLGRKNEQSVSQRLYVHYLITPPE